MTSEKFIERIRQAVYEPSVKGVIGLLQSPPGRQPSQSLAALSQWFNQLPIDEKQQVQATIRLAVRQAVFDMLAVLDGVSSIDDAEERGTLELRYNTERQSVLLNDPAGEFLHDLFCRASSSRIATGRTAVRAHSVIRLGRHAACHRSKRPRAPDRRGDSANGGRLRGRRG